MNDIGINGNRYNPYLPVRKEISPKKNNSLQNTKAQCSYPVYNQVPYGINKTNYIKTGVQKLPSGDFIHTYMLTTGQKIGIVKSNFNCPIIYSYVNVGAYDEPDGKEGMSHLIEHSIYHSSKKYGDVEKYIKSIGGYSNAHTSNCETCYFIKLNDTSKLNEALDVSADMIYNPLFTKLDKEKPVVLAEIKQRQADEYHNILRSIDKDLFKISKDDILDTISGSCDSVNSITREDMLEYHAKHYVPSNVTTVVMSDIEPDELIGTIAEKFKEASFDKIQPATPKKQFNYIDGIKRTDVISKDSKKKKMEIGFLIPKLKDKKEYIKFLALCEIVSKNCGADFSLLDCYNGTSKLVFEFEDDDFSEYETFEYFRQELIKMRHREIDNTEWTGAKNTIIGNINKNYENIDNEVYTLCSELSKDKSDFSDIDIIRNLRKEDIVDTLKYIDMEKCVIYVLHPHNTTKEKMDKNLMAYQSYVPPVIIPSSYSNIDITNSISAHNIKPYSKTPVYSTTLPDNSNLLMLDSKNDVCRIKWKLYNKNTNSYNPAIKFVLDKMFEDTGIDALVESLENGINTDAYFNYTDGAAISAKCNTDNLKSTLKKLRGLLSKDFSEKEFKDAKKKALSYINSLKEKPVDKRFLEKMGIAYLANPEKLKQELEHVTLNDVRKYYNEIISNSYSSVAVIAPFSKKPELFNEVASLIYIPNFQFKKTDNDIFANLYSKNLKSSVYVAKDKNTQPRISQVHSFLTFSNPVDELKFKLLAKVLDKRFFEDLREKQGLAYSAYADYSSEGNKGEIALGISSSCADKGDIEKIFNGFNLHTQQLINKLISEDELRHAKDSLKKEILETFDDTSIALSELTNMHKRPSGFEFYKNNFDIIECITPLDIQKTAQYAFADNPDYLINAPDDFIDKNMDYFKNFGKIK